MVSGIEVNRYRPALSEGFWMSLGPDALTRLLAKMREHLRQEPFPPSSPEFQKQLNDEWEKEFGKPTKQ